MDAVNIDCQEGTKAEEKKDKNITIVVWTDHLFAFFFFSLWRGKGQVVWSSACVNGWLSP